MVRVRHSLNEKLRFRGGHISFFIRRDQRGRGYAKEALRLALSELSKLGEKRAMLTVDPHNTPSVRVIEANGGILEGTDINTETGETFSRYWIEIEP
jgi:predicted acetyltransferase